MRKNGPIIHPSFRLDWKRTKLSHIILSLLLSRTHLISYTAHGCLRNMTKYTLFVGKNLFTFKSYVGTWSCRLDAGLFTVFSPQLSRTTDQIVQQKNSLSRQQPDLTICHIMNPPSQSLHENYLVKQYQSQLKAVMKKALARKSRQNWNLKQWVKHFLFKWPLLLQTHEAVATHE